MLELTETQLKELHRLNGLGDYDMLQYLRQVCKEEDAADVDKLLDMNYSLFVDNEDKYKEQDYFDLKFKVLCKYDTPDSWTND